MTDFHTHILPGIDDGSCDVETSLAMLREEAGQGITEVVLTPHYYAFEQSPREFLEKRQRAWEKLTQAWTEGLPQLRLGAEVQYFEGICGIERLQDLKIQGTEYLLLEMPMVRWTSRMISDVSEMQSRPGIRVVLAHIERYLAMQSDDVIDRLLAEGVLFQSNVSFFAEWRTRIRAMAMLGREEIRFLGSDCHSMRTRRPNWDRLPKRAREWALRNNVIV